jgi:RNA polymerase sigma-70 factor (ECF subfamily)
MAHALVLPLSQTVDRAAELRRLFDAHFSDVHRFARDVVGDAELARDVAQEVFVRLHRQGAPTKPESEKAWLLGMARNVAFEQLRSRRQLRAPESPRAFEVVPPPPTPEAALLGREADRALEKSLAALPEERRTAFVLRVDHRLSYEEIARLLEWPMEKVKNEIHRARLKIRASLSEYMEEWR